MNKVPVLSDFITFDCIPQSMVTDVEADQLEREMASALGFDEKHKHRRALGTFCVIFVCTRGVKVHQEDRVDPSLIQLRDAWQNREGATPTKLWEMRMHTPNTLWNEWFDQWDKKQRLFKLDVAVVPDEMLTAQQKAELKNPKSPLASADEPSPVE